MTSHLTFGIDSGPLNNREIAILFWLIVGLVFVLRQSKVRQSLAGLFPAVAAPVIAIPIVVLVLWVGGLLLIGAQLRLWNQGLVKATLIWFLTTAIVMLFNVNEALKDRHHFRRIFASVISVSLLTEFLIDAFVLPLLVELILQPIIFTLAITSVYAARKPELRAAKRAADVMLALLGIGVVTYIGIKLFSSWPEIVNWQSAREVVLPAWLTLGVLPYIDFITIYAAYQSAYVRMKFLSGSDKIPTWGTIALIVNARLRCHDIAGFGGKWATDAGKAQTFRTASGAVRHFLKHKRAQRQAEADRKFALKKHAGTHAVGDDGRQLDRREFAETKQALIILSTAQMGWHRNRGGRYRSELLEILQPRFEIAGLPPDHGIKLHVSPDGQAWWAHRRTITGWCFAIGAAKPPPDEWTYDGPEPPNGFPGEDDSWGNGRDRTALNW